MAREESVDRDVSELKDTASTFESEQDGNDSMGRTPTSVRIPINTAKLPMILTTFPRTTPSSTTQPTLSSPFQVTQQVMKEEEEDKTEEGVEKVEEGMEQEEEGEDKIEEGMEKVEEGEEQEEEQEGEQEQVEQDEQEPAPEQDDDADSHTQRPRKAVRRNKFSFFIHFT